MKKALIFFLFSLIIFWLSAQAQGMEIQDPWSVSNLQDEMNLFEIWNEVLGTSVASSEALFAAYGIAGMNENEDAWWYETNGGITMEIRYAGYNQSFGYMTPDGTETMLFNDIDPGWHNDAITFQPQEGASFTWIEQWNNQGYWYSDTSLNSDGSDHFVAFEVPVELYAVLKNPNDGNHRLFMLAFEDLSLSIGDRDYNDLVVFVNAVAPAPVPEPSTMVLIGVGLIGLGGLRRRLIR
jgi:hypothetical protein